MERTDEGRNQRKYDKQLLGVLRLKDDVKLLEAANELIKMDGARWEGFALAGVQSAAIRDYSKASEVLATAAKLSPPARQRGVQNAADIARTEDSFIRQVKEADGYWFSHQYDQAAKAYADAWDTSPGRSDVGMRAATAFLMVDKTDLAVTVLSRMRELSQPELYAKITAMLRELGAISEDAKREAARDVAAEGVLPEDAAVHIRREIGTLTTEQMFIAAKPDPEFLSDTSAVIGESSLVGQDREINGREVFYDYKTSIFDLYRLSSGAVPPAQEVQPQLAFPPRASLATPPPPLPPAFNKGVEQAVEVLSWPDAASVTLDKDESPIICHTPCRITLASGRHTLLATLPGYRDAHKIFQVPEDSRLELELEARRGTVNIESIPSRRPVLVNGSNTGRFTPVALTLNEASYRIGVDFDGQLQTEDVQVSDESIHTIRFEPRAAQVQPR